MNNSNKVVGWVALVLAIVALVVVFVPKPAKVGTVTTNYAGSGFSSVAVGSGCDQSYTSCTGTEISRMVSGTCFLFQGTSTSASSISASTTSMVDCQATNPYASNTAVSAALTNLPAWLTGDRVFLTAATSTPFGVEFVGAIASTTAGYIQVAVQNQTGAAFTLATTSIKFQYLFLR